MPDAKTARWTAARPSITARSRSPSLQTFPYLASRATASSTMGLYRSCNSRMVHFELLPHPGTPGIHLRQTQPRGHQWPALLRGRWRGWYIPGAGRCPPAGGNRHIVLVAQPFYSLFQLGRRKSAHFHPASARNGAAEKVQVQLRSGGAGIFTIQLVEVPHLVKDEVIRVALLDAVVLPNGFFLARLVRYLPAAIRTPILFAASDQENRCSCPSG